MSVRGDEKSRKLFYRWCVIQKLVLNLTLNPFLKIPKYIILKFTKSRPYENLTLQQRIAHRAETANKERHTWWHHVAESRKNPMFGKNAKTILIMKLCWIQTQNPLLTNFTKWGKSF